MPKLLDIWVRGEPVGVNHTYDSVRGTGGRQRFKTPAARAWENAVTDTVGYTALAHRPRPLLGPSAWGVDDSRYGVPELLIDLRFVARVPKNRMRLDADAAQKLTLDAVSRGLGLDDRVNKRVTSSITLAPTPDTPTGCLISIIRLSPDDCRAYDSEVLRLAALAK